MSHLPMPSFPVFRLTWLAVAMGTAFLFCACAAPPAIKDYTLFRESRPHSILVMPPVNQSPDINATASFLATVTGPLAESGYYVIPVTLSEETFKQNGVTVANDAQAIPLNKLREIFGADAALYLTITSYGTHYQVLSSVVEAVASAKLVDLRTGRELWADSVAVRLRNNNNSGGGIVGMLVSAAVSQIANTLSDQAFIAARAADARMLSAGRQNGLLFGPYHPKFGTD